ncbi:hypothetical protein GOV07_05375 [Candidatus Woesearchaeota archaeon]|nr:hypothetical protein [Candidatus Woesearchaeota archaeon]
MVVSDLESFLEAHGDVLEVRELGVDGDGVLRDIEETMRLAEISNNLAVVVEGALHPINSNELLHSTVKRVAAFVPERTLRIYNYYVDQRNILDDETYDALKTPLAPGEELTRLDTFADHLVTIDNAFYRIMTRKHPDANKKKESKKKAKTGRYNEIDPNAARSIQELNARFDSGKTLKGPRQNIIRSIILGQIESAREAYVTRRDGYQQAVSEFETQTELLLDEGDVSQQAVVLSTWDVGTAYSHLNRNLEQEDGLLEHEKKDFLRRLEKQRQILEGVVPGLSVGIYDGINEEAKSLVGRLEGVFTDTPDIAEERSIINDFNALSQSVESLQNPKLGDITKTKIEQAPMGVRKALEHAQAHIKFYRQEKERLEILQRFVTGDASIIDPKDYSAAANVYLKVFNAHSWLNLQHYTGAHLVASTIKESFEEVVRQQIADATLVLRDKYAETIRSGGEPSPELEKEAARMSALIKTAKMTKRDFKPFNNYIGSLEELTELEDALREPAEALETRDSLRVLGKAALDGSSDAAGVIQIVSDYKQAEQHIYDILGELSPETPFMDSLEGIAEDSLLNLRGRLSTRIRGLIQRTRRDDLRKLSDGELSINQRLIQVIDDTVLDEDIPLAEDVRKELTNQATSYEIESQHRQQPLQRMMRWIKHRADPFGDRKGYFLDTNVFIQNQDAIYTFGDNIIFVALEVISELDNLKRSDRESVAHSARLANKNLDKATDHELDQFKRGECPSHRRIAPGAYAYEVERDGISTTVVLYDQDEAFRRKALRGRSGNKTERAFFAHSAQKKEVMDDAIIHAAHRAKQALNSPLRPSLPIIFVAQDINARIKARSTGLPTQDYRHDKVVENTSGMYTGYRYVTLPVTLQKSLMVGDISEEVRKAILEISLDGENIVAPKNTEWGRDAPLLENEFVLWRNPGVYEQTCIFRYRRGELQPLDSLNADAQVFPLQYFEENPGERMIYGVRPRNAKQVAAIDLLLDQSVEVVSLAGLPGSGKTFLCTAAFLEMLKEEASYPYEKVYLTKPNVSVGEGHGFLKGTMEEKLGPLNRSFYRHIYNLSVEQFQDNEAAIEAVLEGSIGKKIELSPLAYMRGEDIKWGIRIMDEAQNTRPHEMKTFVTRHSDPTKTIVCGDPDQIDDPRLDSRSNGFAHLRLGFLGQDNYGHITFTRSERSRVAEQGQDLLPFTGGRLR